MLTLSKRTIGAGSDAEAVSGMAIGCAWAADLKGALGFLDMETEIGDLHGSG
jgi:hypothetical protein